MQLYQKCAVLQVFLKDFARTFSHLPRFPNVLEESIFWNTFWLGAFNHFTQFPKHSNPQKSYIQSRRLEVEETQDTCGNLIVMIWQKTRSNYNMLFHINSIYCSIYQHLAKRLTLYSVNQKQTTSGKDKPQHKFRAFYISSRQEMFLGKGILRNFIKITLRQVYWNHNITLRHGCSPVNLLGIFRTPFPKNTSERLQTTLSIELTFLLAKLAFPTHPASSCLSMSCWCSVPNFNKYFFKILINLLVFSFNVFLKKRTVKFEYNCYLFFFYGSQTN